MLLLPHLALVVAPSLSLLLSPRDGHHNNLRLPSSPLRRPILPRRRTSSSSRLLSSVAAGGGGGGSSSSTDTTAPAAVPSSATTPPSPPLTFSPPDMVAYSNGYKTAYSEIPFALSSPTFGVLPPDLSGTYYRSGPAMFSAGSLPPPKNSLVRPRTPPAPDGSDPGRMVRHPFEGDGAVLAITFHGGGRPPDGDRGGGGDAGGEAAPRADTAGKATTRFRYVRTNAFTNERKRGKKLYSGMEGTRIAGGASGSIVGNDLPSPPFHRHHLLPGLNKMRKNTSNTRAVYFGRKLLSLWSGGLPYKLDALALSTDGRSQLGGVVKREDCSMGGKAAIDSKRNRILFYGIDEEQGSSTLNLYEFNSKFQPIRDNDGVVRAKLPGLAMIHDFAVTENYAIFVQPVLKVNGMQFMISKEPGKSVSLEAESSVRGGFRFSIRPVPRVHAA